MTLPASGTLSLNDIANEFGGYVYPGNFSVAGRNVRFSDYFNNGGYIPNDGTIHSSGQISVSMFYGKCDYSLTTQGLWYGGSVPIVGTNNTTYYTFRTILNNVGNMSSDVTMANASGRTEAGAVYYGGGPALLWGGFQPPSTNYSTLLTYITSSGVFGTDSSMAGTGRRGSKGLTYGFDKGLLYGGYNFGVNNLTGMYGSFFGSTTVSSSGVTGTDTFILGTYLQQGAYGHTGLSYGGSNDKGIWVGGSNGFGVVSSFQLVTNTGVIGSETQVAAGVSIFGAVTGCGYGGDKGLIFRGYGNVDNSNQLTNTGVIGSDVNTSTPAEYAGSGRVGFVYGGNKGAVAFGGAGPSNAPTEQLRYISSTGVISGVNGFVNCTPRQGPIATAFGS